MSAFERRNGLQSVPVGRGEVVLRSASPPEPKRVRQGRPSNGDPYERGVRAQADQAPGTPNQVSRAPSTHNLKPALFVRDLPALGHKPVKTNILSEKAFSGPKVPTWLARVKFSENFDFSKMTPKYPLGPIFCRLTSFYGVFECFGLKRPTNFFR